MSTEKKSKLWLFVVAAFALQLAAWTAWFVIAARHPVQEVPLANGRADFSPPSTAHDAKGRTEAHPTPKATKATP